MKFSKISKRMAISILILALVFIAGSVIYYRSLKFLPFLYGILIGSAFSILKVFLLEYAVDQALKMDKKQAGNFVSFQYFIRLALTGVVLYIGAVVPWINLWGVVAGVLSFQVALFAVRLAPKN